MACGKSLVSIRYAASSTAPMSMSMSCVDAYSAGRRSSPKLAKMRYSRPVSASMRPALTSAAIKSTDVGDQSTGEGCEAVPPTGASPERAPLSVGPGKAVSLLVAVGVPVSMGVWVVSDALGDAASAGVVVGGAAEQAEPTSANATSAVNAPRPPGAHIAAVCALAGGQARGDGMLSRGLC